MKTLSIVVPCYNEEQALPLFYEAITKVADEMNTVQFEFIFVNDGSRDQTLSLLREYAKQDPRVHYLSFSRNFFKEAAMYAGLQASKGDYVAIMDADLQDPPSLLPEMLEGIEQEGYDCVASRRKSRKGENKIVSFCSELFYKVVNRLSDTHIVSGARDFRLMTRQMVDTILSVTEYNRFSKGIFSWVGFDTKWLEYDNIKRSAGKEKINFWKRFCYAIEGIVAFSTTPLVLAALIGVVFFLIALVLIVVIIVKTLVWGDPVSGWPSLVCILFFVSGIQLFCTGIIGEYLAKTYLETKKRPLYIVKETDETYEKTAKTI